ncbi:MAG: SDR family NAD(P)-dependent oxidoreductase, partial [Rhodococcus sp. (in: high G+C Gram-positive bacteria)]
MSITKKVVIVTGASQGIGAALVAGYRRLGYAVVATSRSIGASDDPEILTVPGDLSQPGTGAGIVEQTLARFGRIDTLVNNAGIFVGKPFTDYTDDDYDAMT